MDKKYNYGMKYKPAYNINKGCWTVIRVINPMTAEFISRHKTEAEAVEAAMELNNGN
jgi:hypothetical protein